MKLDKATRARLIGFIETAECVANGLHHISGGNARVVNAKFYPSRDEIVGDLILTPEIGVTERFNGESWKLSFYLQKLQAG